MFYLARLVVLFAVGLSSAAVSTVVFADSTLAYRLGSGDEIRIEILGEEKNEFVIGVTGRISYRHLGNINVKGKTTKEVTEILLAGLRGRIFKSPQIVVTIIRYRPYFIQDAVRKPGAYPYQPGLTMRKAIALAGGYTSLAKQGKVFVAREGRSKSETQAAEADDSVRAGDTIAIPAVFPCFVCKGGVPDQDNAVGMVVGSTIFYPSVDMRLTFDDNIFADANDVQSDSITLLAPQGVLVSGTDNAFFSLSYDGRFGFYNKSSVDNFEDHDINGQAQLLLSPKNQLDLHTQFARGHDKRGTDLTEAQPNALPSPAIWNRGQMDALWRHGSSGAVGRFELYSEFGTKRYQNHLDRLAQRDVDQTTVQPRLFYRIGSATSLFLDGRRTVFDYPNAAIDSTETEYLLGVTWDALAKTEGRIGVGVLRKDFDQQDRGDRSFGSWQARVTWQPRTYSEVKLFFGRRPVEPTRSADSFQIVTTTQTSWTQKWTDRLETTLSATLQNSERIGISREDDTRVLGLKVDYQYRRWLHVNAGYVHRTRNSTNGTFDFEKELIYFGLSVTP